MPCTVFPFNCWRFRFSCSSVAMATRYRSRHFVMKPRRNAIVLEIRWYGSISERGATTSKDRDVTQSGILGALCADMKLVTAAIGVRRWD
jgi:hypothetical protein